MFNEENFRKIVKNIFHERFPNITPSWLTNHKTGFLPKLDRYFQSLKFEFEYDGIQHYEYPNPFHKNNRQLDKCKIYGETLIRIKYFENIESCIREEFKKIRE